MAMTGLFKVMLLYLLLLGSIASAREKATPDPPLEKRLVTTSTYRTSRGDTLRKVAHLLYGHRSWWTKLQDDNQAVQKLQPDQHLQENTVLNYRIPEITSTYVVQPNDWFVRILRWKYGETDSFNELLRKNSRNIAKPNLIQTGDKLILEEDGTIRQATSGRVLIQGVGVLRQVASHVAGQEVAQGVVQTSRQISSQEPQVSNGSPNIIDNQMMINSQPVLNLVPAPVPPPAPVLVPLPPVISKFEHSAEAVIDEQMGWTLENTIKSIFIGILGLLLLGSLLWMSRGNSRHMDRNSVLLPSLKKHKVKKKKQAVKKDNLKKGVHHKIEMDKKIS